MASRKPIAGTEFVPLAGAECTGDLADDAVIQVTVVVRAAAPRAHDHDHPRWEEHPHERGSLTEEHLRAHHAHSEDLEKVEAFAREHRLRVLDVSERRRCVVVEGTAHDLANAFGVKLVHYEHEHGDHHGHEGPIQLPEELHEVVVAVLGLNDRPIASANRTEPAANPGDPSSFPASELTRLYDFPSGADGSGQTVAIVELSDHRRPAGYRRSDLETFFAALDRPVPALRDVVLTGSANAPEPQADVAAYMRWVAEAMGGRATGQPPMRGKATVETVMDIELVGAVAPGAELVVYFAPNSESGVYQVVHQILEDGTASVVSFSWAWTERNDALENLISDLLAQAADPGDGASPFTFCAASGDAGGAELCFPASSPWALGCGGTSLRSLDGAASVETVWNTRDLAAASGGGVSRRTPQPRWQAELSPESGRGVPDVAALADPASHCRIHAGGVWGPAGGTSAAAPLWAGLVAVLNQALGTPQGYLNPRLYAAARQRPSALRSVTEGDNIVRGAGFEAQPGWDPCTGLGTPRGTELLAALGRPAPE